MRPLSPELAKIAREELNETPQRVQQDLSILREWVRQQPHLFARTSDAFLIAFLRRCRYSLEETKKRIDLFFSYYTIFPEIMAKRRVSETILNINRSGVYYYPEYPKCTNQAALLIARLGKYCPKKYRLRHFFQFFVMAIEIICLESDNATVSGICEIIDMSGMDTDSYRHEDRLIMRKFFDWMVNCCPVRVKEIYVINAPPDMQRLFKYRGNFFTKLTMKLVQSQEELYKYVPQNCLPEEYGGCNGHIYECTAYMEEMLMSYRDYFDEDYKYGTREELRLGEVTPYEAEFGASGTFRSLPFD